MLYSVKSYEQALEKLEYGPMEWPWRNRLQALLRALIMEISILDHRLSALEGQNRK